MSSAPAWEIAIKRSARRAIGGTIARHSNVVVSARGPLIQVVSAIVITFAARVRSGAVSAALCNTSSRWEASAPSTVISLSALSPGRPNSGELMKPTSSAHGAGARCSRPAGEQ